MQENGLPSTILRKDDEMVIPGDCRPYGSLFDKNFMICAGDGKDIYKMMLKFNNN